MRRKTIKLFITALHPGTYGMHKDLLGSLTSAAAAERAATCSCVSFFRSMSSDTQLWRRKKKKKKNPIFIGVFGVGFWRIRNDNLNKYNSLLTPLLKTLKAEAEKKQNKTKTNNPSVNQLHRSLLFKSFVSSKHQKKMQEFRSKEIFLFCENKGSF